ncbi:FAD-binding oxidoreductase [Allorhizocola rhizosphaerae]|uniref:FAD-binding oxidoreductase n=1 Tax=Allorhizocola rhizosphaerae TaxID=1872709 RepID=UPI000E3C4949|nr:FAD-binding oxidoreductase [Allorhizocola rhizosphaerae]
MRRRGLLLAAGLGLTGAAARRTSATESDWRALAAAMSGTLHRPGDPGYDQAHRLHDPRFDHVRPPAVAGCATAVDVAAVVGFANRFGLAVTARGGGHSYVGASTSTEAIVVDLRLLDSVSYTNGTATIGGGARLLPIYEALAAHGVSIPAGSCGTVGIGGIALGGGFGMAARLAGLTCDAVTGVELVTADGLIRHVDANTQPELLWACRGGGGGQVGIVTRYTIKCFPMADTGSFTAYWPWQDALAVARGWQQHIAPDHVWSTLQFASDRTVRVAGFTIGADAQPELDRLISAVGRPPENASVEQRSFLDVVRDRAGRATRATHLIGSDILPAPLSDETMRQVLTVVARRHGKPATVKFTPLTGAMSRVDPQATAFPWRGAFAMIQWLIIDAPADDAYAWIGQGHQAVAAQSIGRYVNYLEPDAQRLHLYYGRNYDRLRDLRRTIDPQRLFRSPFAVT